MPLVDNRRRESSWSRIRSAFATEPFGIALLATAATWSQLTALRPGADGLPVLAFFASCAAAYVGGRLLATRSQLLAPLIIVGIGAALIAIATPAEVYTRAPRGGPFGYSSITGAFFAQCAFAAMTAAAVGPSVALRAATVVAAIAFGYVTLATDTISAAAALFLLTPVIWVVKERFGVARAILACQVTFVAALVVTLGWAAAYSPDDRSGPIDRLVDATLSERRIEFHHDALSMMLDHPLTGVGSGRYAELSPAVARDADEPWAHHEFLQHGAEAGVLGFALLVLLFLWAFEMLKRCVSSRAASVLAATALCALGLQACVEHIFQQPAVPALAAALVGVAIGMRARGGDGAMEAFVDARASG